MTNSGPPFSGYETLIVKVGDYDLHGAPFSWTKVVAMRHAITKFPDAKWLWYIDQDAFIMNPQIKLHEIVTNKALEEEMIRDRPIVPPDSIIKTFSHLKGKEVELVLTQDSDGISVSSFAVHNGEWAKFMLDTWYDPMYRSYNFQKAELHAMVSRHDGTILLLFSFDIPANKSFQPLMTGAYTSMASDNPFQARNCSSKNHKLVWFLWTW